MTPLDARLFVRTASASVPPNRLSWTPDVTPFVLAVGDLLKFETTDTGADWFGVAVGGHLDQSVNDPGQTHPL